MNSVGTFGSLLQHIQSTMLRQADQILQERLGLGMSQFKILQLLDVNPGMQQRRIADCLGQTEASISQQVKLLATKGLLTTHINPINKREHVAAATPKGAKVTEAASAVLDQFLQPLLTDFSEKQLVQLNESLARIHAKTCAVGRPHACDHSLEGFTNVEMA